MSPGIMNESLVYRGGVVPKLTRLNYAFVIERGVSGCCFSLSWG